MAYSGRHPWDADDPYPDDDDQPDCDHMDYEADILTGFATCACGHRWMQTAEEIERERQGQIDYDKMCAEWEREQRSLTNRLRKLVNRIWPSRRPVPTGDEIPF